MKRIGGPMARRSLRLARHTPFHPPHHLGRLFKIGLAEGFHSEACRSQGRADRAGQMTAARQWLPHRFDPLLPARDSCIGRTPMFQEQKPSILS